MTKRRLTRRDLFKAAPVAGAGAAAVALGVTGKRAHASVTKKGVCRFCLLHCGIEATSEGDRLVRVEGDLTSRARGFICIHGYALPQVVHAPDRVRTPLIRKDGKLVRASWSEALGFIADKLDVLKATYGAQCFALHSGWPWVRHPLQQLAHRFMRAFGSPNVSSVASLCEASLRMGQALVAGTKYLHDVSDAKTVALWGANPERSAPALAHVFYRWADEGRLIVVDPTRNELVKRGGFHLQVRPGTDGALALSLAHVLIEEGLYDRAFVEQNVEGFDGFRALAAKYRPGDAQALTSVNAERLVQAARRFGAEKPARTWPGLGVEHHENGVQTLRALAALDALSGAYDAHWMKSRLTPPGERFGEQMLPALPRMVTPEPVPPPIDPKPIGYDAFPLFDVYNREAQGNLYPRAILEGQPYPLRALLLFGSNPLLTSPDAAAWDKAAGKLDLLVVADPFMSLTAERAHVVLPASTFAEGATVDEDDTRAEETGVVAPQHESWPDWKILFELARAMGNGRYFPWGSLKAALEAPVRPFMQDDAHQIKPDVATADKFGTASGKVELDSRVLKRFGFPGLPEWTPPSDGPNAQFPLLLVSGPRGAAYINSQFRSIPSVHAKAPEPLALVHPNAGIEDDSLIDLVSDTGRVRMRARVTEDVHPETVVAPFGWEGANVNLLNGAGRLDPISGFPAMRSIRCRIEGVAS
jgi:formate dehydrogenase (coenzyme F420) alpha subunit